MRPPIDFLSLTLLNAFRLRRFEMTIDLHSFTCKKD